MKKQSSRSKNMAAKKRRKHGEVLAQVRGLYEKNNNITPKEVSQRLGIAPGNASRALKKIRIQTFPSVQRITPKVKLPPMPPPVSRETVFVAQATLVGLPRALELVHAEIARLVKVAAQ